MIHYPFVREPGPGRTLRGEVRIPEGPPPRSAVVVVHGFKGFKDWGFFPYLAERLAGDGHAVVTFNFTGSGIGAHPERFTEFEAFAKNTYTRELDELGQVIRLVRSGELLSRAPRSLGLLGHSRGGGDVVLHAAGDEGIDALVTWAAVATFDRWTEETRREWREWGCTYVLNTRTGQQMRLDVGLLEDFERNRERLDVTAAASRIDAPWLVVHGLEDMTVTSDEARLLASRGGSTRLVLVEGGGHTFGAEHPFQGVPAPLARSVEATLDHFAKHLDR